MIQSIQQRIKNSFMNHDDGFIEIVGSKIKMNPSSAIFITLNPLSKDYQGRRELTDSLKSLFRPIIMSQPDLHKIFEVILISQNFPWDLSQ